MIISSVLLTSAVAAAIERRYSQLVGLPLVQLTRYPGSASGIGTGAAV